MKAKPPEILTSSTFLGRDPAGLSTASRRDRCRLNQLGHTDDSPEPGLSPAQKKVIERDYGMRGGSVDLKVRKALLYYTKHRLRLDLDPKARRPEDQHVVLSA